jgi:hypothetical protein
MPFFIMLSQNNFGDTAPTMISRTYWQNLASAWTNSMYLYAMGEGSQLYGNPAAQGAIQHWHCVSG